MSFRYYLIGIIERSSKKDITIHLSEIIKQEKNS